MKARFNVVKPNWYSVEDVILELRPHHVLGYATHEAHPEFYDLTNAEYIARFREEKGDFHSDRLILHWRDAIKKLHENPDLKFRYVQTIDSICRGCEHIDNCHDLGH